MSHPKNGSVPLAELVFGLLIVGLLAAVAIPPMVYSSDKRVAECQANVVLLGSMIERYATTHNGWAPKDQAAFERMVVADKESPSGTMPRCPYGLRYDYDPLTGHVVPHQH
ncbi:MAG: type II secretion system protein [Planctomycetota bacterium]|jgi:Tfp pilus assembly protein PilE|nr:type II secretion system protein [Planctomycetota bacterium]